MGKLFIPNIEVILEPHIPGSTKRQYEAIMHDVLFQGRINVLPDSTYVEVSKPGQAEVPFNTENPYTQRIDDLANDKKSCWLISRKLVVLSGLLEYPMLQS